MTKSKEAKELVYWASNKDWYIYDGSGFDGYKIKPDAPERAQKSFEAWLKQRYN